MATKTKNDLVIVESPAKAKTITKYLGPGYEVKASMGHVRDLPKSKIGVDVEKDFSVDYQPIKGKEDIISDLKKTAKKSERVFLATDPDREGEAISWHLKELLDLPADRTYRVTFNEITKKVVNEAIAAPRQLDMDLVDAQQARRVLDRVVGYQISPFLWKKIRRGLSAGRVQSVATRLVCEREEEIRAFQAEEYWSLDAALERIKPNVGQFTAQFYGREKKQELHNEDEVKAVMAAVEKGTFSVTEVKRQDRSSRRPAGSWVWPPGGPWPLPSSFMRAWTSPGRGPWVLSPICVPTPSVFLTRRWPTPGPLFWAATARSTIRASPGSIRPGRGRRMPTKPSGPPT